MSNLIIANHDRTKEELLIDFDLGSFKYEYEKNSGRSISLTAFKTNVNADIYDMLQNEAILIWRGQQYIIKTTNPKSNNIILTNQITAFHIMFEFQNHFIDKDLESEELNNEVDEEHIPPTWTLEQYLTFGFKDNKLGYSFKIVGDFDKRISIDEVGNNNGIEFLIEGAALFDYIFYADNKTFYIYDDKSYYRMSDIELIGGYNVDEANVSVNTQEQKTYIRGYGKKKSKKETKNYSPFKPPDLSYSGKFFKEGTWRTQEIGASYQVRFKCKWGNETLTWSLKKLSRGGLIDIYLDDKHIGRYSCYSHTARSEQIVIARNLSEGYHTFKAVHRGADPKVKKYRTAPVMYVGVEKSITLNLTAVLKGTDLYHVTDEHYSPYYDENNPKVAPTIYDDNILDKIELKEKLKESLNDEPIVELSTNYLGTKPIHDRDMVYFKHKRLGFDTTLKVVKLVESYPLLNLPVAVDFSNRRKDILKIQQEINRKLKQSQKKIDRQKNESNYEYPKFYSDVVGVTLLYE